MRIAVRFALEFDFDGSRPGICLAIIAARIEVGNGQSALYLLGRIARNPLLVLGLVPNAEGNANLRSIAFSMKLPGVLSVAQLVLPVSGSS